MESTRLLKCFSELHYPCSLTVSCRSQVLLTIIGRALASWEANGRVDR